MEMNIESDRYSLGLRGTLNIALGNILKPLFFYLSHLTKTVLDRNAQSILTALMSRFKVLTNNSNGNKIKYLKTNLR